MNMLKPKDMYTHIRNIPKGFLKDPVVKQKAMCLFYPEEGEKESHFLMHYLHLIDRMDQICQEDW